MQARLASQQEMIRRRGAKPSDVIETKAWETATKEAGITGTTTSNPNLAAAAQAAARIREELRKP